MMMLRESLNSYLDNLARPSIMLGYKPWSAFKLCGLTGLFLACVLCFALAVYQGLSLWVEAAVALTAIAGFYLLGLSIKVATGKERFTYYHHQIAFLCSVALLLKLIQQPVLPFLDISILGVGLFMACGRIGCLMVGCCHGQPSRWGVRYCREHAAEGFTPYYVGVRLFPIQAIEALWVLCSVLVGVALVLWESAPGTALGWYVISYASGRFCFEFMRGDAERPYLCGFSEAQWTSLLLVNATLCAALLGLINFHPWQAGAAILLALAMFVIALRRRLQKNDSHRLLHPRHVREIAEAVEQVSARSSKGSMLTEQKQRTSEIPLASTSLGLCISASEIESAAGPVRHYTFSCRDAVMNKETAETLASLILKLKHLEGTNRLVKGKQEVFHLLVNPQKMKRNLVS